MLRNKTEKFQNKGFRSEHRNKSTKNVETKALKYSPRGPKTGVPKIQKDIAINVGLDGI